jgi:phosphopantetheine--protein transferase-like protein
MREPVWPLGIVGSITHGGVLAAAVALPSELCQGIGVDIEQVAKTAEAQHALRSQCVSAREYFLLESLQDRIEIGVLLTLVFSAKESFFKATSVAVGHYFDFDAIEVRAIDPGRGEMTFALTAPLCADWPVGAAVRVQYTLMPSDYLATLFAW